MSETALFPRKLASHIIKTFFTFYIGSRSKSGFGTRSGTGTVMHSGSGSAEAKSYGSCGSGPQNCLKVERSEKTVTYKINLFLVP
jgi:hypothetical protein